MDQRSEALLEEALGEVVEETVEGFDPIDGDDDIDFEDVTEDEPASEQDIEDVDEEEELVASDEAVEDELEPELEEVVKTFEQTGNPDDLPPELIGSYKLMQAGFTKKMQEVAAQRTQYEELNKKAMLALEAQQKTALEATKAPRPKNPTEDMSFEEQQQRWAEINRYDSKEAYREMIESGAIPDPDRVNRQLAQQEEQTAMGRRYNMIASQEGYTDEVHAAMAKLTGENEYWNNAITTDEGAQACFDYVKNQLAASDYKKQAAELENARVKRSAGASKRATPKATTQTKAAVKKPAENFADLGFEGSLDAIIKDTLGY